MKKSQIVIGASYVAKISGALTIVQITHEMSIGKGWTALNRKTGRRVEIRSAQRLRQLVPEADAEQWDAEVLTA